MRKNMLVLVLLLGLAGYAMADLVTLSDTELLTLERKGGTSGFVLDSIIDIPGDPGLEFNVTTSTSTAWTYISLGSYNAIATGAVGFGDTWEQTFKNLDVYPVDIRLYFQVDGWSTRESTIMRLQPGETNTISFVNPATTAVNSIGFKIINDTYSGRPASSPISVQIIPEPATLILLGLGGLLLRRK